jgi:hypothetical protein
VVFSKGGLSYSVPGFFAGDGNAAHTGATGGNVWMAHFSPPEAGEWTYSLAFFHGVNIHGEPSPANPADTITGTFKVEATDKDPQGRDFRGKGWLEYVGGSYLRFRGNAEYFLKQGPDSPENFLAYSDFDGDFKTDGIKDDLIKDWKPHIRDWRPGDPTWTSEEKGKGIIGSINYLASEGLNSISFLTMNINGDDRNVFPYTDTKELDRMDISRMDQWEMVFAHATRMGMFLHFKTQETENETLLDGGDTGPLRKLYYRELIARFAHHPALNWNFGEENGEWEQDKNPSQTSKQRRAMVRYFAENDPYQRHRVLHNGQHGDDMLGEQSDLTGWSLQTWKEDFSAVHGEVLRYLRKSSNAGKPWAVACDEPGDHRHALRPDANPGRSHIDGRKNGLWGTLMAGGWGNEWYFGYEHPHSDLTLTDFRSRDRWWDYTRHALDFFRNYSIPFWEMKNDNGRIDMKEGYVFGKEAEIYVIYLKNGGTTRLHFDKNHGNFEIKWYNPRSGGQLVDGSVKRITGSGKHGIGLPPSDIGEDWVAVIRINTNSGKPFSP